MQQNRSAMNPWAVCHSRIDKNRHPERFEKCVQSVKQRLKYGGPIPHHEDTLSVRALIRQSLAEQAQGLGENAQAEKIAMSHGIEIAKVKSPGGQKLVVLKHPKLGQKIVRAQNHNLPVSAVRDYIRARGQVKESFDSPAMPSVPEPQNFVRTATMIARRRTPEVEVIRSGLVQVSGANHQVAQVWEGDRGVLIGSDGNRYTLVLANSGRVLIPKEEFDEKFRILPDEELLFRDSFLS